jgi:hypothetical protein
MMGRALSFTAWAWALGLAVLPACSGDEPTSPGSMTSGASGASGAGGNAASGGAGGLAGSSSTSAGAKQGGNAQGGSTQGGSAQGGGGAAAGSAAGGSAGGGPVTAAGVRWFGRVDVSNPNEIKLGWSGTGFIGNFSGPSVSVKLKTVGSGEIYFQPVVDGTKGQRFGVGEAEETVEIASGLAGGEHVVELYRETEGKGFGYSVFSGFAAGTPGTAPAYGGRSIEVIGDSISAGYGNLGVENHTGGQPDPAGGCGFTTETESAYLAYGHVAARAVGADASVLAGSGWGIYSDNGGNTDNVMPKLFGNTLGEQATPAWNFAAKPQAVVINLGTNDASAGNMAADKFKPAYTAFVASIREKYPDALILFALGSLMSGTDRMNAEQYMKEIISELAGQGDSNLKFLDLGTQDVTSTGCDWHPDVDDDERMAGLLADELKATLGW